MLDIYNADGFLDRGRVLDEMNEVVSVIRRTVGATQPKTKAAREEAEQRLVDLLDECSEGFMYNPLDAPTMTREYINACRPPLRRHDGRA